MGQAIALQNKTKNQKKKNWNQIKKEKGSRWFIEAFLFNLETNVDRGVTFPLRFQVNRKFHPKKKNKEEEEEEVKEEEEEEEPVAW